MPQQPAPPKAGQGRMSKDLRLLQRATATIYNQREGCYIWGRNREYGSGVAGAVRSYTVLPTGSNPNYSEPALEGATQLTFGPGGDYATWEALVTDLNGLGAFATDYECTLIGDIVETVAPASSGINLNGHTLRITCAWGDSHQGDPTRGYKISTSTLDRLFTVVLTGFTAGVLEVSNIFFENSKSDGVHVVGIGGGPGGEFNTHDVTIRDNLVKGPGVAGATTNGFVVYTSDNNSVIEACNMKIWDCAIGNVVEVVSEIA